MSEHKNPESPIEILPEHLSEEAMAGIVENFILREGTDYGLVEISYEKKAEQIRKQIYKGEIKIVFDQSTETVSLLPIRNFKKLIQNPDLQL